MTVELKIDVKEQQRDGRMEGNLDIRAGEDNFMSFLQPEQLCHISGTAVRPEFTPTVIE